MHFDLFYFWRKKEKRTFYETCSRWVISTTSHLDCKESVSNFTNIFQHYGWFYFSCYEFLSLHFTFQKLFFTPVHSHFIPLLLTLWFFFHLKLCILNLNLIKNGKYVHMLRVITNLRIELIIVASKLWIWLDSRLISKF